MGFERRVVVAARLTVTYAASLLIVGLLTGRGTFVAMGVLLSWPLYALALVIAIIFAKSILTHPAVWCAIAVLAVATICLLTLPFDGHINSVATVGIFCATVTGIAFYFWNVRYPIQISD